MKNKILIVFMTILLFTGCQSKAKMTDAQKFKKEYEGVNGKIYEKTQKKCRKLTIAQNNPMKYATAKDIITKMNNKETFLVYFGFSECPWCRSMIETLIDVADDEGLDNIYYVDIQNIRDTKSIDKNGNIKIEKKGTNDYYKLLELMDNVLTPYELDDKIKDSEKRIYAPNIITVINGETTSLIDGTSSDLTDPYMKLTDKMLTESYKEIKCSVDCIVKESTCTKNAKC